MTKVQGVAALMLVQGLLNLAMSALVIAETVLPEPTDLWYWCLGPGSLASGTIAILAAFRKSRGMGLLALGLLGVTGLAAYKLPSGVIISVGRRARRP